AAEIDARADSAEAAPAGAASGPDPLSFPEQTLWVRERLSPGAFVNHREEQGRNNPGNGTGYRPMTGLVSQLPGFQC
ncbi:MAG: hypothetical protein ACK2UH_05535, partial [Candidatus Promineifilaceae bacterium]